MLKKSLLLLGIIGFSGVQLKSDYVSEINEMCSKSLMAMIKKTKDGNDNGNLTGSWLEFSRSNQNDLKVVATAAQLYTALHCYERGIR